MTPEQERRLRSAAAEAAVPFLHPDGFRVPTGDVMVRSPRQRKTHCKGGHEYVEGSFRWRGSARICIQCQREKSARAWVAKKAEASA